MADRIAEFGPVERVEVEIAHPAGIEAAAQFGGDGRGDELARGGQVVEPIEQRHHPRGNRGDARSEEHTSELQSLMRISYAVICLKKKNIQTHTITTTPR